MAGAFSSSAAPPALRAKRSLEETARHMLRLRTEHSGLWNSWTCVCACARVCVRACARVCARMRARVRVRVYARMCARARACIYVCAGARCAHARVCVYECMCMSRTVQR